MASGDAPADHVVNIASQIEVDKSDKEENEKAFEQYASNVSVCSPGMTLSWTNVGFSVPVKKKEPEKVILKSMTGAAEPGQIVAILGGSGAGKSTFLNVLAGRIGKGTLTGAITVNGKPRQKATWRKVSAYVEQLEVMFKNLTVTETLQYGAQFRLPSTYTKEQKAEKVDRIIQELGLVKCKDTKIGDSELRGISGGEKKRVSIGLELLSQPSILFLDEPTSGLDAFTAVNIIATVSKIAKTRNTTVLMTIHQPRTDILEMCDKILLLAGGESVFFGPLDHALEFFSKMGYPLPPKVNPSDHFLDIVTVDQRSKELMEESSQRIEKFARAWDKEKLLHASEVSSKFEEIDPTHVKGKYNSSWFTQFTTLLGRNFKESFRNPAIIGATLGQGVFMCVVVGFIFYRLDLSQAGIQNRLGALFFLVVNQTFGVVMPLIGTIPLERPIILRERAGGSYQASAAFFAKWISSIPLTLIGTSILALPVYWIIGFQSSVNNYGTFYVILLVHSFAANAMGTMIGSGVKTPQIGQIMGPLVITIFLIFGGSFLNLDSAPVAFRWIQYISIISFSNKALAQNEFIGLVFTCPPYGQCLTDGSAVIKNFSLGNPGIWPSVIINLSIGITFATIGYILFRKVSKPLLRLE
ncbi:hypothetical protein HDU97_009965 [Phlyctochytrium planicorne]|nr:hypothetical protein HDU97_009965 [Phlyctochytrium planicorne]